jgi:hypothetical protein
MELSKQCVSLELAKRLNELGVKQSSIFFHTAGGIVSRLEALPILDSNYSAFTCSELGEILQWEKLYIFGFPEQMMDFVNGSNTEVDAMAKMVIHLIENGHIKMEKSE